MVDTDLQPPPSWHQTLIVSFIGNFHEVSTTLELKCKDHNFYLFRCLKGTDLRLFNHFEHTWTTIWIWCPSLLDWVRSYAFLSINIELNSTEGTIEPVALPSFDSQIDNNKKYQEGTYLLQVLRSTNHTTIPEQE